MKRVQHLLFISFLLFESILLFAQDNIHFDLKHYTVADGLSHRQVNTIHQDKRGFIWVGTDYGLNRFDGNEFQWWTKEVNGLTSNRIRNIVEDAEGFLWVMDKDSYDKSYYQCIKSIDLLHTHTGQLLSFEEKFGMDIPFQLEHLFADDRTIGEDGTLYFGTHEGARLISYHPEKGFMVHPIADHQYFFPIIYTQNHTIWGLADDNIILEIDTAGNILHQFKHQGIISPYQMFYKHPDLFYLVRAEREAPAEAYQVNQSKTRIAITDIISPLVEQSPNPLPYDRILFTSENQTAWVFRPPADIIYSSEDYHFNLTDYLPELKTDFRIGRRDIFVDNKKRIWLAGEFGLYRLEVSESLFEKYLYSEDLNNAIACRGIAKLGDTLLVGTERYDLKIVDEVSKRSIPSFLKVQSGKASYSLLAANKDKFCLGRNQLFQLDLKKQQFFALENQENDRMIWAMERDVNGRIWMGRYFGIDYYDPNSRQVNTFTQLNDFDALSKSVIIDFIPIHEKTYWLCTNKGIFELDIEKGITSRYWTEGKGEFHIPHNDIRHIHQDKEGIYWLATGGAGLVRWDKEKGDFQQYTRAHGLANNFLYAIYEDDNENLWMSSDYGIIQFNKNTAQSKSYLVEDGITHNEFNRISHYKDKNGRIYFGSLNGVTAFQPKDFYEQDTLNTDIPLQISKFEQFNGQENQIVDQTANLLQTNAIIMKPNDRFFRLEFALLTYEASDQTRYAYRIEEIDKDWTYQKESAIRISRLPYGIHTLRVKGQAADGQWSSQELAIKIKVLKPFYLQFWFISLATLLFLIASYFLYRFYLSRKLTEAEAENLKRLNALKSRFYTNITHEFRTPLTVILGMNQEKNNPKAKELIDRNGKKLLQLINQLLDLSKLDSGKLRMNYQQIEMVSFTQYIGESFQSLADKKYIRLMIYSEIKELWMDMDEEKYCQIISNLLSNAVKFTRESGKIILHLVQRENQLQIKVKDNGIGIAEAELPHIFDRFYQVDNSASREGQGTGVGLSLVKELVELMDGKISVESNLKTGTNFNLHFPIRQTATSKVSDFKSIPINRDLMTPEIIKAKKLAEDVPKLLLIEDNPDVVTYIQSILQSTYELSIARNGEEGIQKAIVLVPDIIISDVMMPKKNGFEVVDILKQDERTSHIPIVLLTAKATQEDKVEGLKYGADAYLMKPFDKEELFIRLKKLIEIRQQLQTKYANRKASDAFKASDASVSLSLEDQFLQKVQNLLQENYQNSNFKVENYAQTLQLSHTQFYRKLKALTNQTPSQYIRNYRLEQAKILLKNLDFNISEVAYEVGFSDPNYFTRTFTKEFGLSPNAYRN